MVGEGRAGGPLPELAARDPAVQLPGVPRTQAKGKGMSKRFGRNQKRQMRAEIAMQSMLRRQAQASLENEREGRLAEKRERLELDRDEAAMTAAWNLVWRAWPWLCTAALIGAGIVLYPAAHFAWVNVW